MAEAPEEYRDEEPEAGDDFEKRLGDSLDDVTDEETYTIEQFKAEGRAAEKGLDEDSVDPEQLAMGIEVEYEHTNNEEIAKKIALDHLAEFPDYYTALAEMEDMLKAKHGGGEEGAEEAEEAEAEVEPESEVSPEEEI